MTNPTIKLHDVETGEVVERSMNKDELSQNKADVSALAARITEASAIATAKEQVLSKLGLTAEEASALLG
jgi:hypothetical protein